MISPERSKDFLLKRVHLRHMEDNAVPLERLRATGAHYVPGRGSTSPVVVFVGEAPGAAEDRQRRPFCGPSGRILEQLLSGVGLSRDTVYITNIVKYRPPGNRDPFPSEKAASLGHLWRELRVLGCPYVVTLGRHPMMAFLGNRPLNIVRGHWHRSYPLSGYQCRVLPLYHPAVGLYKHSIMPSIVKEFERVLDYA